MGITTLPRAIVIRHRRVSVAPIDSVAPMDTLHMSKALETKQHQDLFQLAHLCIRQLVFPRGTASVVSALSEENYENKIAFKNFILFFFCQK